MGIQDKAVPNYSNCMRKSDRSAGGFSCIRSQAPSIYYLLFAMCTVVGCTSHHSDPAFNDTEQESRSNPFDKFREDTTSLPSPWPEQTNIQLPAGWVDLALLNPKIILDIRYATIDNFVESQLYDCPRCLLRDKVAEAINAVHDSLSRQGLGLKMFDCYRPKPVQEALWSTLPDPRYVTNPARGSMHNRGAAVDLTIVDSTGAELDMGTGFDYFGNRAYHTFRDLSDEILANRRLLMRSMHAAGFRHIRTEWWHYSFEGETYDLASFTWPCP